jgi:Heparinase II/III-like protein/Heparinase II/III N-terminus
MRLANIIHREPPLLLAREALWRARRAWGRRLASCRFEHPGNFTLRSVPYFKPALRAVCWQSRALIIDFADEIRAGRFPFLSYGTVHLGKRPKWNLDFVSSAEWPHDRCELRDCIREDGSDVKAPLELSRLQFLPVLGKAHVLTGNEAYRQTAKDLLSHWLESNPVPVGVNWTVAMEAALRAMSICFLSNLLWPFRPHEQPWLAKVTHSLSQHLMFIETNLEFSYLLTSNHYLSDLVGLYCLSMFLDGEGMEERRRDYRQRIETEMARQVYEDGGNYEASTGYHVLVTQLFTAAFLLMRAEQPFPPAPAFLERLRRMFRFLSTLASESGELPQVGDCDDGRIELLSDDLQQMLLLPPADRNSLEVSSLLGIGQRLFGEGKGPGDDAAWHGLVNSGKALDSPKSVPLRASGPVLALPKSGIGIIRHGRAQLLFFAMPNGISGKGSHTHNDKLSFVLRIDGREVISDSGTGCYTRDTAIRNFFRRTAAHNTVMIDGTEQNHIAPGLSGLFVLGNEATVSPIQAGGDAQGWFLRASHYGYRSLGVMHTRTVRLVAGEQTFVIEDAFQGQGRHDFEFNLQLASHRSVEVKEAEGGAACRILGDSEVQVLVSGPADLHAAVRKSAVSRAYGETVPAMKVSFWGRTEVPARIITTISWAEAAGTRHGWFQPAMDARIPIAVAEEPSQA